MSSSKSTADITGFVKDFQEKNIHICVEEPETSKEKGILGTKEYTTFLIMTKKFGADPVGVRHRYSEFESLRTSLRSRYGPLGVLIPSLPSKKILGKGEWSFVVERMYGLSLFCEAVAENPFLVADHLWSQFAYPSDYAAGVENPGEMWLLTSLQHLKAPEQAYDRMASIQEEIVVVEYYVKASLDRFKATQNSLKSYQKDLVELHNELARWTGEEEYLIAFGGRGVDTLGLKLPANEKPLKTVGAIKDYYERRQVLQGKEGALMGIFECAILEHVVGLIESMKEIFKSHTTLTGEIDALETKIHKLTLTKNPNPKTDAQLMEYKSTLTNKQALLESFYKSFFHFSLPLFARRRAALMKRLALNVASYQLTQACAMESAGRRFFEDVNYSSEVAIANTSQIVNKFLSDDLSILKPGYAHVSGEKSVSAHPFSGLFERAVDPSVGESLDNAMEAASTKTPARPDVWSWPKDTVASLSAETDAFDETETPPPPIPAAAP
jgi:hypothetical protein